MDDRGKMSSPAYEPRFMTFRLIISTNADGFWIRDKHVQSENQAKVCTSEISKLKVDCDFNVVQ